MESLLMVPVVYTPSPISPLVIAERMATGIAAPVYLDLASISVIYSRDKRHDLLNLASP
jgi:hypothetical protein